MERGGAKSYILWIFQTFPSFLHCFLFNNTLNCCLASVWFFLEAACPSQCTSLPQAPHLARLGSPWPQESPQLLSIHDFVIKTLVTSSRSYPMSLANSVSPCPGYSATLWPQRFSYSSWPLSLRLLSSPTPQHRNYKQALPCSASYMGAGE